MKRLVAVRLVHWYHFVDETFRLDGSTLLLGDNGSGKSTVLDAIQLALVADLTQVRFNKAANENSRRSLYGYVRHKIGTEDERRPGQLRFGRGSCTSHVMLAFDDDDGGKGFVCGVALEASEADVSVTRWHWVLPGSDVAAVPAVDGDEVRALREFRQSLARVPGAKVLPDPGTYREELRHRLGALPESFHRLIVKSLDFKPLGDVRQFVFDYLLDERPIDTDALQRNLEHYKKLEGQAKDAEDRIAALTSICELGRRIDREREHANSHRFMSLRAKTAICDDDVAAVAAAAAAATRDRLVAHEALGLIEQRVVFFERERDRVLGLLQSAPGAREIREIERDLDTHKRDRRAAVDAEKEARATLAAQLDLLDELASAPARELRRRRPGLFVDDELVGARDPPDIMGRLRTTLARDGALVGRDVGTWARRLDDVARTLAVAEAGLVRELAEIKDEASQLEREQKELEAGKLRYDEGAEALLHLLRAKLKGKEDPKPLCELVEVKDPRWQDAVEGFLNTRRFDVIVAPEDFPRALQLYERNKRDYHLPGRGVVFIANAGLVDVERVMSEGRPAQRGSLAEHVTTNDPRARAYVDAHLGDVICVDDEQALRRHKRAITDTVMVYSNHVARQTARRIYERHYIGVAARQRRLEEIALRQADLSAAFVVGDADQRWVNKAFSRSQAARTTTTRLPDLLELAQQRPHLEEAITALERQLDSIDKREVEALQAERHRILQDLAALLGERDRQRDRVQELTTTLTHLAADEARVAADAADARRLLDETFPGLEAERREIYEARFVKLLEADTLRSVLETYERQAKNIESRVEKLVLQLVRQKTEYANARAFVVDVVGPETVAFADELERWQGSRLPEYRARIAQAREESIQQLAEDMVFRLREGLDDVRRQIDALNRALKEVRFGSDRYQFSIEVSDAHRPFHDLILQAAPDARALTDVLSPTSARATLEDLFSRLTHADARAVKEELAERADYRAYFDYDLIIHHADGSRSRYGRIAGDKSGGETQTPYYIAIFASAHRLYRSMSVDGRPSCGLLLLDEAFAKMDEGRIKATLRFARELKLQLLIATPKERADLVAPLVETSIYIHKDPRTGVPTVLDFTKELAGDDDGAASEDSAPLPPPRGP